jgi:hypothetical protein
VSYVIFINQLFTLFCISLESTDFICTPFFLILSVNSSSESLKRSDNELPGPGSASQASQASPFEMELPEQTLAVEFDLKTLSHQKALQILEQQRGGTIAM